MTHLTWGIPIPGYSYPSQAQIQKFDRMYPGARVAYLERWEQKQREVDDEQRRRVAEDRERVARCLHTFVPTNIGDGYICTKCKKYATLHKRNTEVQSSVLPVLKKSMPVELTGLESVGDAGRGRARITAEGETIITAMAWL